jgi:hypothetical protein
MLKFIFFFFIYSFPHLVLSQSAGNIQHLDYLSEEDKFIDRLSYFIPWKEKYRYSEFRDGYVYYAMRKESNPTKLNFNRYRSLISMIDEKGDTVFVANFEIVKYIIIDKDLYYHDYQKGYFEILSNPDDSIRLAVQRQMKIGKREKLKDYEIPKNRSTKNSFSLIYKPLNPTFPREEITISRIDIFYLMTVDHETRIANKSAFFNLFPNHKHQIQDYLLQQAKQRMRINFRKEEDLKKLLTFCSALK